MAVYQEGIPQPLNPDHNSAGPGWIVVRDAIGQQENTKHGFMHVVSFLVEVTIKDPVIYQMEAVAFVTDQITQRINSKSHPDMSKWGFQCLIQGLEGDNTQSARSQTTSFVHRILRFRAWISQLTPSVMADFNNDFNNDFTT